MQYILVVIFMSTHTVHELLGVNVKHLIYVYLRKWTNYLKVIQSLGILTTIQKCTNSSQAIHAGKISWDKTRDSIV